MDFEVDAASELTHIAKGTGQGYSTSRTGVVMKKCSCRRFGSVIGGRVGSLLEGAYLYFNMYVTAKHTYHVGDHDPESFCLWARRLPGSSLGIKNPSSCRCLLKFRLCLSWLHAILV